MHTITYELFLTCNIHGKHGIVCMCMCQWENLRAWPLLLVTQPVSVNVSTELMPCLCVQISSDRGNHILHHWILLVDVYVRKGSAYFCP